MASLSTLSAPVLYTSSDLQSDTLLVTQICDLINDAFSRSKISEPEKWGEKSKERFPNNDLYFEMLGSDGVVAITFDEDTGNRKVIAVAAAVPWQGGWKKEGAGFEEGWEIKAVAVDGNARYHRRGLAVQLYAFLEQYLILKSKRLGRSTAGRNFRDRDQLTFWILAAECINGEYWRKKGYELVRKDVARAPTWGTLTSFEMVVLRKDVPFELSEIKASEELKTELDGLVRREVYVK